ncbi:MAG TPA: PilZ domain-containing protein [Candidatus Hydrogenedentes bacterium]|mgnify:CR=1 FL=1|nr:PilZ domain-containing protein [Candidatus Hydrogenedentota bacterium]HOS02093.1 PilZ domain-containing protein [Candidatus Hydrogenedentota bacterium]
MPDEMFFSRDMRSLRRGRRRSRRNESFRPCHVWPADDPDRRAEGIVLDMSPHGMRIRMIEAMPEGSSVHVQLMRDESFQDPLAQILEGVVVRDVVHESGFIDHGVALAQPELPRQNAKPLRAALRRSPHAANSGGRMHTIDITLGDRNDRRTRR